MSETPETESNDSDESQPATTPDEASRESEDLHDVPPPEEYRPTT